MSLSKRKTNESNTYANKSTTVQQPEVLNINHNKKSQILEPKPRRITETTNKTTSAGSATPKMQLQHKSKSQ